MLSARAPLDLTGTVRLDSAAAVADAATALLAARFPANELDPHFLRRSFEDIEAAFWGQYPGYLACDTPYHDLRHSLDTALLVARMIDGYQLTHGGTPRGLNAIEAELAVFLALYHDIGFLRRDDEAHLTGAALAPQHEERSVAFVRTYLAGSSLSAYGDFADLIHATSLAHATAEKFRHHGEQQAAIAKMIGSADLISQIADRNYLERCRDFLYREFAAAGLDRSRDAEGREKLLYRDGEDLLTKTPAFYDCLVNKRLKEDFDDIQQVLTTHFGASNPYAEAMEANINYLRQLIAQRRLAEGLRRRPTPLMPGGRKT